MATSTVTSDIATDNNELFNSACKLLDSLGMTRIDLTLSRMNRLMEKLGHPQNKVPTIHVAGTNGKGSVIAILSSILRAAGYTVGSTTSPHLWDVRERIQLNGKPVPKEDFAQLVFELDNHLKHRHWPKEDWPTYFEFLTAMAFLYFAQQRVDIALVEVGLGGRLDATNVIKKPLTSVITSIGLDHTDWLGDDLCGIAREKAGIIKKYAPVVIGSSMEDNVLKTIKDIAKQQDARISLARNSSLQYGGVDENGCALYYQTASNLKLPLSLIGPYQEINLATALKVVEQLKKNGFHIPDTAVVEGCQNVCWPGRFQVIPEKKLILDGSHNDSGFKGLSEGVQRYYPDEKIAWVLSLRSNRPVDGLIKLVSSNPNTQAVIWTTGPQTNLYHGPTKMAEQTKQAAPNISVEIASSAPEAVEKLSKNGRLTVVTGSLYTLGEFRETHTK